MATEIEVKYYVPNLATVQTQLETWNAIITHPRIHERNQLFLSPYQDFKAEQIVLRLRQDTQSKITYKAPPARYGDSDIMGRLELETIIGDYDTMQSILEALGYSTGLFYEKYRTVYELPDYPAAEIMLDELPYGNFIEIEGEPATINAILAQLDLPMKHRIHTNYAGIFWAIQAAQNLEIEHIRFADFTNIDIDKAIFETI